MIYFCTVPVRFASAKLAKNGGTDKRNKRKNVKMVFSEYFHSLPANSSPRGELARRLATACHVDLSTVYRWAGGVVPDALKREKVSEVVGIPVDELFPEA